MKYKAFVLFALLFVPQIALAECYLAWDAPTTDTTGAALVSGDIDAYRLYVLPRGQSFVKGQHTVEVLPVSDDLDPATSVLCSDIGFQGSKHAVVTAYNRTGGESDWSNEVVIKLPGGPKNLRQEDRQR
jgi:hypothetical protein